MADKDTTTSSNTTNSNSSIFGSAPDNRKIEQVLKSMDKNIAKIAANSLPSQSAAQDMRQSGYNSSYRSQQQGANTNTRSQNGFRSTGNVFEDFMDEFESQLMDGLVGSDFKANLQGALKDFTDLLGVNLNEVPAKLGQELGKKLASKFKESDLGKQLEAFKNQALSNARSRFQNAAKDYLSKNGQPVSNVVGDVAGDVVSETATAGADIASTAASAAESGTELMAAGEGAAVLAGSAEAVGAAMTGAAAAIAPLIAPILAATAGLLLLDAAFDAACKAIGEAVAPAKEGLDEFLKSAKTAANRYQAQQTAMLQNQKERAIKDNEAIVNAEFQIIEDAANRITEVWDNILDKVSQTQGYTKAGLQELMSNYAQRLSDAGLTSVVSAADISENLSNVLEAGLSGTVAEEFAYVATVLNEAVPTEDWFSYASDYATVAALAMQSGMSQAEAIEYANSELETFASNILYASRELSGGFSTGLKNASELFSESVKIANTSKTGVASAISGVLTAVSSVTSAISSDNIASELVSSIAKAATGGNSSELVALRSLAGINASNTEFLRAFAEDPQGVFEEIFRNLGEMQNMSNSNFMEVAEGLAGVFGVSMDALAQVDFAYLADSVASMSVNTNSLSENMALLASGETTSNAQQTRYEQINKYILDEGLSYVLDNEVARSVQENMWAEQRANEIMQNTYAVDLAGGALSFLQGIAQAVDNIINILNPFSKIMTLELTAAEAAAQRADLSQILELGKVGAGNAKELYNLTTTGQDLSLTNDYLEMLGGISTANVFQNAAVAVSQSANLYTSSLKSVENVLSASSVVLTKAIGDVALEKQSVESAYNWGTVSKSLSNAVKARQMSAGITTAANPYVNNTSATAASASASVSKLQEMVNTMRSFVDNRLDYDDWAATARQFGIANLEEAFKAAGVSEQDLRGEFQSQQAQATSEYEQQRDADETVFWDNGNYFWTDFMPVHAQTLYNYDATMITNQETQIQWQTDQYNKMAEWEDLQLIQLANWQNSLTLQLTNWETVMVSKFDINNDLVRQVLDKNSEFYASWVDYYVNHTAYSKATLSAYDAAAIQNAEKSEYGDAILGLAEALTSNQVDLLDPTVQQNALLSKLLLVVEAILQNTNSISTNSTGGSIATTLSALGLGL